ncbi:tubulin alpha [Acrasis kona]|uniref:Tubulin alpha n=1 Tax=Acrasis kona TaxID=1008807 RepID=A0AAW2Z1D9_9EUKA
MSKVLNMHRQAVVGVEGGNTYSVQDLFIANVLGDELQMNKLRGVTNAQDTDYINIFNVIQEWKKERTEEVKIHLVLIVLDSLVNSESHNNIAELNSLHEHLKLSHSLCDGEYISSFMMYIEQIVVEELMDCYAKHDYFCTMNPSPTMLPRTDESNTIKRKKTLGANIKSKFQNLLRI